MLKRLKDLRIEKNLTQEKLASNFGLTYSNIGEWERGKSEPSIEMIIKLADFFKCTVDYLLGREDDFGNVTVVDTERDSLSYLEKRLLTAFAKLDVDEKDKLIYDAEYFAGKHDAKNPALKKPLIG